MLKIGDTIKGYKLIKELNSDGGQGFLYEAENEIGKHVAIKLLKNEHFHNEGLRKLFLKEAKIMVGLHHDNIVGVIDFFEDENIAAIIMDLLKGEDLQTKIKNNKVFSVSQVIDWYKQILSAFEFAHSKGVVHRDVKPSNIFITDAGFVKILDFGIAKILDGELNITIDAPSQFNAGTPFYKSPEQILTPLDIDGRSDIYTLGLMMYLLLTGETPYDMSNEVTLGNDILNKVIPYNAVIPAPLFEVIKKATAKDKTYRFVSAKEFSDAIDLAMNSHKTLVGRVDDKTILDTSNTAPKVPPPVTHQPISPPVINPISPIFPPKHRNDGDYYNGHSELQKDLPKSSFIYSGFQIKLAAFFGGIFCGILFFSRNFKRFGESSSSNTALVVGIVLEFFVDVLFIKNMFPSDMGFFQLIIVSRIIYVIVLHFLVESYQKYKILEYIKRGGEYESTWKVLGITLAFICILAPVSCVSGIVKACSN